VLCLYMLDPLVCTNSILNLSDQSPPEINVYQIFVYKPTSHLVVLTISDVE
jgi:hypothetical protein